SKSLRKASFLAPLIGAFQASYPRVRVQVSITDRIVHHTAEGIDLAFRIDPRLKDSSLLARKILTYRHQLLASPATVFAASATTAAWSRLLWMRFTVL